MLTRLITALTKMTLLVLLIYGTSVSAAEWPNFPFIFVTGKAKKEVPPNLATVTFEVKAFDEKPEKALSVVATRAQDLAMLFKEFNIPEKDITAYQIDKQAVREQKDYTDLKILGYEVSQRFSVKLYGLTAYVPFFEKLLPLKNVVDLNTGFDVSERETIESELVDGAITDAKSHASHMASGAGAKLGAVYAVSEISMSAIGDKFAISDTGLSNIFNRSMRKGPDTGIIFVPSTIALEKTVDMIFKIETDK